MYKEDLALNSLQWLISHKTKPNPNYFTSVVLKHGSFHISHDNIPNIDHSMNRCVKTRICSSFLLAFWLCRTLLSKWSYRIHRVLSSFVLSLSFIIESDFHHDFIHWEISTSMSSTYLPSIPIRHAPQRCTIRLYIVMRGDEIEDVKEYISLRWSYK